VEAYERQADNSWLLREEIRLDAAVNRTGATLPLAEIYDRVEFFSTVPPRPRPSGS